MSKPLFLKDLAIGTNFNLVGGILMQKIGNTVFKLDISTNGYSGHYVMLKLSAINTVDQKTFDHHTFKFNDYLAPKTTSRTDHHSFEVVEHCGWEWYIKQPSDKSVLMMFEDIREYCSLISGS